ncbi:probable Glycine cleavage system H protein, mitochondrial precursor [Sporisorium scitamineum]|uniref:Glycine cleavage system H protein n=3 Tax=Sporisorium scitamineum TaxID=49012 RepID=A0A127ZCN2_9BASI|nr:probable Glycine cleavage system H protein, mitochondrial precursor [Sporisorium scitamineum]
MFAAIRPTVQLLGRSAVRAAPKPFAAPLMRAGFASSVRISGVQKRFTEEHEWVSFDDATNIGTVGITDYAQKSLGDVVFIELPEAGAQVKKGDDIGAVESVKAASDIYAPVSGQIETVNKKLNDEPSLLNKAPESDGWLCQIKLSNPSDFETLLTAEAYQKICEN